MGEAVNSAKEIANVMRHGGFRLTKFISNDKDVMNSILVAERAQSFQTASFNDNLNEQTLGVKWDVMKDVTSIFDLIGFEAPFLVTGKIFLRELWRLKIDWDDRIITS